MKTKITLGTFAILLALFFTSYSDVIANAGGSPGGRSSSGGDMGGSCGQGGCHGGGHTATPGIIVTDSIPAAGYTPGMTYRIGVAGTSGTSSKFGFELAAENAANATAGTFASIDARTQILTNGHATHTNAGNSGVMGAFGWQLNWTAPAAGTGTVTFSAAVLVANNNGTNSGDATIINSRTVNEATTTTLTELGANNTKLYPNPIGDNLNIYSEDNTVNQITILTMEGKLMYESAINSVDQIDVSFMNKGMYFVTVRNNGSQYTTRMIKL